MDDEFNITDVEEAILPAILVAYARNKYVGHIEIFIREIKERMRSVLQALPYKIFLKIMIRELIEGIIKMINTFPVKDGVSKTLSPGTIMDGRQKFDKSVKWINFEKFAFIKIGTTNTMK